MHAPKKVLFIGTVFPEPTSSAAGVRTVSLLEDFLSRADRILFASPSDSNAFSAALREKGIETVQIGPNDSAFDSLAREYAPDVVIFDRFMLEEQFGWRVAENAPQALRVLDTIDLHFLRRVRGEWLVEGLKAQRPEGSTQLPEGASVTEELLEKLYFSFEGIETEDFVRELASIYRCDLTLILSTFEEKLLAERFGISPDLVLGLGFAYSAPVPAPVRTESESTTKHFVSIGNFRHLPNRDSAFWLARVLWPAIRKELAARGESEAELHLYGAYPPKEIMQLDRPKERIRVFGPADDSVETLKNYRTLLAPIRFGAGIKGKIADAWAASLPVVTTPVGSEGMSRSEPFAGAVAITEADFIQKSVETYLDFKKADSLVKKGHAALSDLYSTEKNRKTFLDRIDLLTNPETLKSHRAKNFIGRILLSEIAGRVKYLSKWIEAKNNPPSVEGTKE